MRSLAIWVLPAYQNDELFRAQSPMNRDNCLAPFHLLKANLEDLGWRCHTQDFYLRENSHPTDVLFIDMPQASLNTTLGAWREKVRSHLLIQECEVVLPRNWELSKHEEFTSVFTWHPDLIRKGERYAEVNFSQDLQKPKAGKPFSQRKLCTMIAGNKGSSHPLELYSQRVAAIRFFEKRKPKAFDLYGVGWDQLERSNLLYKALNKLPLVSKWLAPKFPSYKGKVANKRSTLQEYRFAICFENAQGIEGYVTEKIFDCLMAGCVPVYWGAPDIAIRIPKSCYIDFQDFKNFEKLLAYLEAFEETQFQKFLSSATNYLESESAKPYSSEYFANAVVSRLSQT